MAEATTVVMPDARSVSYFFHGQARHAVGLLLLLVLAYALAGPELEAAGDRWLGLSDRTWFCLALDIAIVHQVLVWLVFRSQLGWGLLTRLLGDRDLAVWQAVFLPLLSLRAVFILGAGLADSGSLALPREVSLAVGLSLLIPGAYAIYSIDRYFGIPRAVGGDHFRESFRKMPLVREGAFRWTSNAMYGVVFLLLWSIAFLTRSHVALVAALFQHAYIWVHYFCTESPDMELLYGKPSSD
ncbi:MAG: hypothetical protein HYV63_25985 [Candidatus Schekmanbacteria bacterium]|nr:hypothetical protein [Candidatus Schekmanbacteria bacterium]